MLISQKEEKKASFCIKGIVEIEMAKTPKPSVIMAKRAGGYKDEYAFMIALFLSL